MNAPRPILTDEKYEARLRYLRGNEALARSELAQAELRASLDDIDDAALTAARTKLADAEAKLRGLELAKAESERLRDSLESAQDAAARAEATYRAEAIIGEYMAAVEALEAGIEALEPHLVVLAETASKIIHVIQAHAAAFHPDRARAADNFSLWVESVRDTQWLRRLIDGSLFAAGFGRLGFVPQEGGQDPITAEQLGERLIRDVLRPLAALLGDVKPGEEK